MALQQKLELRQSQQLVMTQQLQQSIKLLQLSAPELQAFVEQELEKNPLLTRDEAEANMRENEQSETQADAPRSEAESVKQGEQSAEQLSGEAENHSPSNEVMDDNYDSQWQAEEVAGDGYHAPAADRYSDMGKGAGSGGGGEGYDLEQFISSERSLREHLEEQLVDIEDMTQRLVAEQLIGMLDESGYLREAPESLAQMLGVEVALVEEVIAKLQQCDPAGVFARDLGECLALQLRERNRLDPAMEILLTHLDKIAKSDVKPLAKLCGVDHEDIAEMLGEIRALNPKPASEFIHDAAEAITPDVFIRHNRHGTVQQEGEGRWHIELNSDALPRVLMNQKYATELSSKGLEKDDKSFISEQISNASWLVKALDQRARTILKVSQEIVKQQEKFFLYGIRHMRPLTLKEVADAIEMHESTVSRVTTQKYLHTPRGIFEMKYFFTSSLVNAGDTQGDGVSSKTVMHYIRELIEAEDPKKILSDDKLVSLLAEKSVTVARRTVAKYREAMHIPASPVRRRQKKML